MEKIAKSYCGEPAYWLNDEEVEWINLINNATDNDIYRYSDGKLFLYGNFLMETKRKEIEPEWGENIQSFIKKCLCVRKRTTKDFKVEFNNTKFEVESDDTEKSLYWKWKYYSVL